MITSISQRNEIFLSPLPCYKIGELSGITDFNNFVRLFKKEYHMTPAQYRKNHALH